MFWLSEWCFLGSTVNTKFLITCRFVERKVACAFEGVLVSTCLLESTMEMFTHPNSGVTLFYIDMADEQHHHDHNRKRGLPGQRCEIPNRSPPTVRSSLKTTLISRSSNKCSLFPRRWTWSIMSQLNLKQKLISHIASYIRAPTHLNLPLRGGEVIGWGPHLCIMGNPGITFAHTHTPAPHFHNRKVLAWCTASVW